jgi:hypothetical protein
VKLVAGAFRNEFDEKRAERGIESARQLLGNAAIPITQIS